MGRLWKRCGKNAACQPPCTGTQLLIVDYKEDIIGSEGDISFHAQKGVPQSIAISTAVKPGGNNEPEVKPLCY